MTDKIRFEFHIVSVTAGSVKAVQVWKNAINQSLSEPKTFYVREGDSISFDFDVNLTDGVCASPVFAVTDR